MRMHHIVFDLEANTSMIQGKTRRYTVAELERAEATPDDPASQALLADIAQPDVVDMEQLLHDCPECAAAYARGERPKIYGPGDLAAIVEAGRAAGWGAWSDDIAAERPARRFARRPRWRTMKRR